jgi:two-component system sensor histidine kinase NblS
LISNALKFTHPKGRIVIRIYSLLIKSDQFISSYLTPEIVRLEIIDEGIGIHKIFQKQIFERFMRIENNIHTLKGTGLGLSIVQNIIKKHNSLISVYSEVNMGTSFWFDLFIAT